MKTQWDIYVDGGSKKKDGTRLQKGEQVTKDNSVGASGVVWLKDGELMRKRGYTCEKYYTNNMCELAAILYCLRPLVLHHSDDKILIHSDSAYSINVVKGRNIPKTNAKLILQIRKKLKLFSDVHFVKVKGHSGNQYNDMADGLCTDMMRKCKIDSVTPL